MAVAGGTAQDTGLEDQFGQDLLDERLGKRKKPNMDPFSGADTTDPNVGAAPNPNIAVPRGGGTSVIGPGGVPGAGGIAPGEGAPNSGPPPVLDQPVPGPAPAPAPPAPARTYATIAGLDTGKLQDDTHQTYKYGSAARALSSFVGSGGGVTRGNLQGLVDYAKREFGLTNAKAVGDDKVDFGDGSGPIDIITAQGGLWWGQEDPAGTPSPVTPAAPGSAVPPLGARTDIDVPPARSVTTSATVTDPMLGGDTSDYTPQQAVAAGLGWVPKNHPLFGTPGYIGYKAPAPAAPAAGPAPGADPGAPTLPDPNDTSLEAQIRRMLYQQYMDQQSSAALKKKTHDTLIDTMGKASAPVDANAPEIKGQQDAYNAQQQRAMEQGREALAEHATHNGMSSGEFDASLQSSYENAGQDSAAQAAKLQADAYSQKIQELESVLNTSAGLLSDEESNQLQNSIATMKARLDKLTLDSNAQVSNRDIDVRSQLGNRGLDEDAARRAQDDSHFYDDLGFRIGSTQGTLQQQLIDLLMGKR